MPPAGFELSFPAYQRPQTYALDRAATGIDLILFSFGNCKRICHKKTKNMVALKKTL
jgi:cytochrome oxidase Cu insertion factor (SCO1/SenC/PrrC family)